MENFNSLISIVILNYNSKNLLTNCVESILKSTYKNYEIIVVDNNSKDQSQKKCKEQFNQIKLIQNTENLGYCEGNNVGIRQIKGEFVIILNPDTLVDPNWILELIKGYNKFGTGLYQPKLLTIDDNKIIGSAGNMINLFGFGYSYGRGHLDNKKFDNEKIISYASGTCLFTSKKVLEKIGLLDSFLFAYHDDLEFGWRAAEYGIKSYYIPNAIVYHAESFNFKWSPLKFYYLERNRHYCILTHYSRSTFYKIFPNLILIELSVLFFYLSKKMLLQKLKAYLNIIKNRKYIKIKYNENQKNRILTDKEIVNFFQDELEIPSVLTNMSRSKIFYNFIHKLSKNARKKIS
jgi:GT2 family glycosyltransferase